MQTWVRTLIALVLALTSLSATSERVREQGVTDTEIRIGNVMPYSRSLEVFGAIGKAEAAYFEMINERGGINGRKVRFISYDDKSDPSTGGNDKALPLAGASRALSDRSGIVPEPQKGSAMAIGISGLK